MTPPQLPLDFSGADYKPERDRSRLTNQLKKIFDLMSDGRWRTVEEIHQLLGFQTTSISANLRNLRKRSFGGYDVPRERMSSGVYRYRLNLNGRDKLCA